MRFETAKSQMDLLSDCKELHDRLQQLEVGCYVAILAEVRYRAEAKIVWKNLMRYAEQIEEAIADLRAIADRKVIPSNGTTWIQAELEPARRNLSDAAAAMDLGALKRAISQLTQVFAIEPGKINTLLTNTAVILDLPSLVTPIQKLLSQVKSTTQEFQRLRRARSRGLENWYGLAGALQLRVDERL